MDQGSLAQQICEVGRLMYERGFVAANDGNISVRVHEDRILTTPTGVSKGFMSPDEMVEVRLSGPVEASSNKKPSSELLLHLYAYRERPNVGAVVHAHPIHATGFATAGVSLEECVAAEIVATLGSIPLAKYGTPSTWELPETIRPYIHRADAVLLANHGVVTFGKTLMDAYFKLERIEHYAQIILVARQLGGERVLPPHQVEKLFGLRSKYAETGLNPGCATCAEDCIGAACLNYEVKYDRHSPDRVRAVTRAVLARLQAST